MGWYLNCVFVGFNLELVLWILILVILRFIMLKGFGLLVLGMLKERVEGVVGGILGILMIVFLGVGCCVSYLKRGLLKLV